MTLKNFGYVIKLAFQGIFRNSVMSFASLLMLISCFLVTASTYLLSENIGYNIDQLSGYNKIVAFAKNDSTEPQLDALKKKLQSIENIDEVVLISKDEALTSYSEKYGKNFEELFASFNKENPLKPSFEISYREGASVDEVETIVYEIRQLENEGIVKVNNRHDIAQKLTDLKNIVSTVLVCLTLLLFVISVFVVTNTVRLAVFARRDEISIMRNVGATRTFVAMPFLLEGIILGLIAGAISYFGVWYLYRLIVQNISTLAQMQSITILPFYQFQYIILIAYGAIVLFTGFISGFVALRRQKQG